MTVQAYLETVAACERTLRHHLALQAWLREQIAACDATPLGESTRGLLASRAEALAGTIEEDYRALDAQARKVRNLIGRLPDADERSALTLRFLDMLPHDRAAEAMYVSARHLYRIQHRALMHLEGMLQ